MNIESRTPAGAEGLSAIKARPGAALIAFDFDGTLAPIVDDPAAARAQEGTAAPPAELAGHVGRVAVITGRPAALAVEYGGLAGVQGLVVLGQYGRERWEDGVVRAPEPPLGVAEA